MAQLQLSLFNFYASAMKKRTESCLAMNI